MAERIAVETLTLKEVSDLLKRSLEIAHPRARGAIAHKVKKLEKAMVSNHKWIQTYEIFKGAKLNFYCQKIRALPQPIVSIGMTHRTAKGLILMVVDTSNGGLANPMHRSKKWENWVIVYTAHYCERYAERIMNIGAPTFEIGAEGIMFADTAGVARVTDTLAEGVDEIAFQFNGGQAFGYRDNKSKAVYYKTVYSNDMLRGGRLEFRQEWKESITQLNEWFKWE
jgi:hypothetical protein